MRTRLFREWCIALAIGAMFAWAVSHFSLAERIDLQLQDVATSLTLEPADDSIVVVAIDDRSLGEVGPWPWTRERQAELLDAISAAQPDVVALDILYLEPSDEDADAALAASIARAGNVILPYAFTPARNALFGMAQALPIPALDEAAAGRGHVGLGFDPDGIVRHVPLLLEEGADKHLQFAAATYRLLRDMLPRRLSQDGDLLDRLILPLHPAGSYSTISASEIIARRIPPELLGGKIVLAGATAQGLRDRYSVPTYAGQEMAGVEIQANLLDALLHDSFVVKASPGLTMAFAILPVVILFLGFWALPPRWALHFSLVLAAGVALLALLLPLAGGIWIAPGAALAAIALSYPLWGWRRLASVADYLQAEASGLERLGGAPANSTGGFDFVARQIDRFHSLITTIKDRFGFIGTVIRAAPDPILVLDRTGTVLIANESAVDLFGEDAHGKAFEDLMLTNGAELNEGQLELLMSGERSFRVAWGEFQKAGDEAEYRIVQFHDISAIRRAEREREETLAFISHDMRTPQAAIIGLTDRDSLTLDEESRLSRIRVQAERTLRLADDFVQLARLRERPPELEAVDLVALAQEAADRFHFVAVERRVVIAQDHPDVPLLLLADPILISRMIDNLLDNAIKFSSAEQVVTIATCCDPDNAEQALLIIADEGPGLPPGRAQDPFARFGDKTPQSRPSAGLGLALAAEVVERHCGRITASNLTPQGTEFRIELPLLRSDPAD